MSYTSLDQIAHLLKMSPRMVNLHVKQHGMPRMDRGQYDIVAVVHWYIDYLKGLIKEAQRGDETEQQARARLVRTTADIREYELGKLKGELIEVAEAKSLWERLVVSFKTKMLSIPTKAPQRFVICKDINEIKDLLEREIYEALDELSRTGVEIPDNSQGGGTPPLGAKADKPTTKAHRKPVGGPASGAKPGIERGAGTVEDGQS
jgi:phage terminase Nu1 subunit (DNA packaging protein)